MMKRIYSVFCTLLSVCILCACTFRPAKVQLPVNFYYCAKEVSYDSEAGIVAPEIREGSTWTDDSLALFNQYLAGPVSEAFISPFPAQLQALELTIYERDAKVVLSDHLSILTGHDLTMACVCLSRTLMELSGASCIEISVPNRQLDGKPSIVIHQDNVLFWDTITPTADTTG